MRGEAVAVTAIGIAALAAAVAAVVKWGGLDFADPPTERTAGDQARWWLRLVAITMLTAITSGILVAGFGGRLAMRVIAATAGDDAQGRITEAEEVVGEITLGGTIGFLIFVGVGAGILTAVAHLVLRPVLPPRRAGGALLAVLLLVVAATRIDPLRADNPDFELVGPDLLSVTIFGALPLLLGLTVAAVAARLSHAVPLLDRRPRTWPPYLSLAPALLVIPLAAGFLVAGAIAIAVRLAPPLRDIVTSPRFAVAARVVVALAALLAAPGFVTSIADILRG